MYQIKINRDDGNGWTLDGCWGSDHARFEDLAEADRACAHLREQYPDARFEAFEEDSKPEEPDLDPFIEAAEAWATIDDGPELGEAWLAVVQEAKRLDDVPARKLVQAADLDRDLVDWGAFEQALTEALREE